jgi:hypothetical protein
MLHLIFLQAIAQKEEFHPPLHIKSTAVLKKALNKEYLSSHVAELSSGGCRVTCAFGQRTSGLTVVDIFVYMDYRPRGVKTGSKILAASLYGRSVYPLLRIVKTDGEYSLLIEYSTRSKKKISEVISLSLFNPTYIPY